MRLRAISCWLLVSTSLFALAGCGGGAQQTGQTQAVSSSASAGQLASGTVRLQSTWAPDSDRGKVIQEMLDAFQRENPAIKVEHVGIPYDRAKVITQLGGGTDVPDIMVVPEEAITELASRNVFVDLTDQVGDMKAQFYEPVWQLVTLNDRIFGLPWFGHTMELVYNKNMFTAAGLDPNKGPTTWDELYEFGKKLTDPAKNQYGFGLAGKQHHDTGWYYYMFVWQAGGELLKQDNGKWRVALNSPEGLEALKFYLKLREIAPPETPSMSAAEIDKAFLNKQVAMYFIGPWAIAGAQKSAPDIVVGAAQMPKKVRQATLVSAYINVIPRDAKNKPAAIALMRYLSSPPAQEILIKGEKGQFPFRMPNIKAMETSQFFTDKPEFKPFVEGYAYARPIFPVGVKNWERVHRDVVINYISQAVAGSITAEDALKRIDEEGNKIMAEAYP